MEYGYTPSTSRYALYPVKLLESALYFLGAEEDAQPVRLYENQDGDWGDETIVEEDGTFYPMPGMLWMKWWSVPEQKCYDIEMFLNPKGAEKLWKEHAEGNETERYKYFVFGLSPYGGVAVWLKAQKKSVLFDWQYANEEPLLEYYSMKLQGQGLIGEPAMLPPKEHFDQNMQQYTYRYVALEDYWNGSGWQPYEEESDVMFCDHVEERLYDGTRDQLGSEYLFDYHQAGMPKNLTAVWFEGRDEYRAYFWINREGVLKVFQRVYYKKPDAKADFIIRFDPEAQLYDLAIRREDMAHPISIPKDGYEVLLMRNGNRCWRSENYSLDRDAWHW